jgi:proline dehydrogenase
MNEERALAAEQGVESPVWDTIEDTHNCYNECMVHIIENLKEASMLFIASHNADSVDLAKDLIVKH